MVLAVALLAATFDMLDAGKALSLQKVFVSSLIQVAIFLIIMERLRAYRVERYANHLQSGLLLVIALLPGWLATSIALFNFAPGTPDLGAFLALWFGMTLLALLVSRRLHGLWLSSDALKRLMRRRVVIVGVNEVTTRLIDELRRFDGVETYELCGVFRAHRDDWAMGSIGGIPVVGPLEALGPYASQHAIDVVYIADRSSPTTDLLWLIENFGWISADILVSLPQNDASHGKGRIVSLGNLRALEVMARPLKGSQGLLKIMQDYVVAGLALVLLAPLMLLIAAAIRLESKGPAIFRQTRLGFENQPFQILKFRTMHIDPQDDATRGTMGRRDPRITRVGAILRRTSLDELPQLLNVLRGEMSVVGPRPYVADMLVGNERFSGLVRRYAERHRVKPGITGHAQALGLRSFALRSPDNARRSIDLDLHYIHNWSILLDIQIMLRTVLIGMTGRNVF
ncbi:exopolysaccharide biosynthesis polyprenyl glycosylphosphotransferase [Roseomonas tokyonensis]|nr:exopolysaccharide biosynthesis polyprenyl glycosylphosphotransferase [Falsiroseomonas tokyonensis]